MKPLSPHWADQAAVKVIAQWGEKDSYVVASGITPSGTVHIGNFREEITSDFVARALRSRGKKVRQIHSWDDFDTFRKIPANFPNHDMLKEHMRKPISRVPDPFGKTESYARGNELRFENELKLVGIEPEFIYQHQMYSSGKYAEQIKVALENTKTIKAILDVYRTTPEDDSWLPTSIFCEKCDRDEMDYERYEGEYRYAYKCTSCGHEAVTDIRQTKNLKLGWRSDWPMRWAYEKVDFEPGGKDHSSEGSSFDTGKVIIDKVWQRKAPAYVQYDFVMLKGVSGKMSSSKGELITVSEALKVYTPQMIRWIFSNQKPNKDFSLAFDEDVIKVYDEFDRGEAFALGEAKPGDNKWEMTKRAYELSCVKPELPKRAPYRPPFRELGNRLQLCDGNIERTIEKFYVGNLRDEFDRNYFYERAERAWNWLKDHAPEEFRYQLHKERVDLDLSSEQAAGVAALRKLIERTDLETIDAKDLNQLIYDEAIRGSGCEPKMFFAAVYHKLIGREQGPRLPSFLKEIGKERTLELL